MFPTTQNSATSLAARLAESKVQNNAGNSGKAFMKFDFRSGDFVFGRDAEDITGERIAINVDTICHGWVLWHNGTPSKKMVPFNAELPEPMPAKDGDEPSEGRQFEARFLDDDDTVLVFETNSYGGRKGVDTLLTAVMARAMSGEAAFLYPVVELNSESYKSSHGSTVHNPIFKVVDWMDATGAMESDTKKIESKPAEAADEPAAEEQPVRRRRRSA